MEPRAVLYAYPNKQGLNTRKITACANFNKFKLETPSDFVYGVSNKTPEYIAKFPLGRIPCLSHGSFHLQESLAIAQYVASQGPARKQLLGGTPEEQAKISQFLFFSLTDLAPTLATLCLWRRGSGKYHEVEEANAARDMTRWLSFLEHELSQRHWLVDVEGCSGPSLADLAVGEKMFFGFVIYIDGEIRQSCPRVVEWYQRLVDLPETRDVFAGDMTEKRRMP